jgi:outer membrane protein TolC
MQRFAELRAAGAEVKAAQRSYYPILSIDGHYGLARSYGDQIHLPGVYSPTINTWDAQLSLTWTLFDGLAREKRVSEAQANRKQAAAGVDSLRYQVENQVWSAYSIAYTALYQQKAAAALLAAATEAYNAALKSYTYGLSSEIDVVAAQRALANARAADVNARTQSLTGLAVLGYQTGELLHANNP